MTNSCVEAIFANVPICSPTDICYVHFREAYFQGQSHPERRDHPFLWALLALKHRDGLDCFQCFCIASGAESRRLLPPQSSGGRRYFQCVIQMRKSKGKSAYCFNAHLHLHWLAPWGQPYYTVKWSNTRWKQVIFEKCKCLAEWTREIAVSEEFHQECRGNWAQGDENTHPGVPTHLTQQTLRYLFIYIYIFKVKLQ